MRRRICLAGDGAKDRTGRVRNCTLLRRHAGFLSFEESDNEVWGRCVVVLVVNLVGIGFGNFLMLGEILDVIQPHVECKQMRRRKNMTDMWTDRT